MNKIEKLLNEFCPDGVEFKDLGDVLDYEQPWKYLVDSTNYDNSYKTPVLTAWQTFILWYTDEEDWIYQASKENPVIIFDDFTTAFKWVDFSFKAKSSAMKMLTSKNIKEYNLRYIFFAMSCLTYSPQDHARQWIQTYSKIQIPIPPIEIQKEIVKILDNFTLLEAELEAELEARKKQYEYYRDDLLSFWDDEVEMRFLEKVYKFQYWKGNTIPTIWWDYPVYGSNWIVWTHNEYNSEDSPVIGHIWSYAGIVNWGKWKHFVTYNGVICKLIAEDVLPKYAYNQLLKQDFNSMAKNEAQPFVSYAALNKTLIPVPSQEKQQEIVTILDKFDALVNDISVWLPAELKARRQQYEYYRNKLLDFKVLEK